MPQETRASFDLERAGAKALDPCARWLEWAMQRADPVPSESAGPESPPSWSLSVKTKLEWLPDQGSTLGPAD
jgi:hypothetical protein